MTIKCVGIQGVCDLCITPRVLRQQTRVPSLRPQKAWKLQCGSRSTALGIRQPGVQIPAQQLACCGHFSEIDLMHIQHVGHKTDGPASSA